MSRPPVTCHILDTTRGKPAADVTCSIYYLSENSQDAVEIPSDLKPFGIAKTNSDGRIAQWVFDPRNDLGSVGITDQSWSVLKPGIYKIKFLTGNYFKQLGTQGLSDRTFFPFVEITFIVDNPPDAHYHVPLLLSNHSYTTYRGS